MIVNHQTAMMTNKLSCSFSIGLTEGTQKAHGRQTDNTGSEATQKTHTHGKQTENTHARMSDRQHTDESHMENMHARTTPIQHTKGRHT